MGPGAPDVGGAVVLLLGIACQFSLLVVIYWRLVASSKSVAAWPVVARHAVGVFCGLIVSVSAVAATIWVAKCTGLSLPLVMVLLTISMVYLCARLGRMGGPGKSQDAADPAE